MQIGLGVADLDLLTIGTVFDMMIERGNDEAPEAYARVATQEDFDNF